MLDVTEQVAATDDALPKGMRVYEVDGYVVWASNAFRDHLQTLQDRLQNFIDGCPLMNNLGDNQRDVEEFCRETGLLKPCYGEHCVGCDYPDGLCASPDADWR